MSTKPAPPTATPAAAWHRTAVEGELYTLPGSGHVARLRRPSLYALIAAGVSPSSALSPELARLFAAGADDPASDAEALDNARKNGAAFLQAAALALVEPRLVLDRAPDVAAGEIGPQHLADRDLVWIYYQFIEGAAAQALPFRVSADPA